MPELPEVETIVRDLKKEVLGRTFVDVWTDFPKMVKLPKSFEQFKKEIKGKKIQKIWRRGKNIIFELTEARPRGPSKTGGRGEGRSLLTHYLLIHQKLTGHLLLGKWQKKGNEWRATEKGPLAEDPMNRFLHLIFWLDNNQQLVLSDLRKFAKVELLDKETLERELSSLGPEPLEKSFTLEKFKEALENKKGKIKQVLMDQTVIAGIGNIYSDEILWEAKIHPLKEVSNLSEAKLKKIYMAIKKILPLAIELKGESFSDFRRLSGEKGYFDKARKVYRREGEKCSRCGAIIKRIKLAGRSAHFCPSCQK